MASRPFAFGARFSEKGRTVRIRQSAATPGRYAVERSQRGGATRVSEHPSLVAAIREFAAAWRGRLH